MKKITSMLCVLLMLAAPLAGCSGAAAPADAPAQSMPVAADTGAPAPVEETRYVQQLTVNVTRLELALPATGTIGAQVLPQDADDTAVLFTSSDETVATVDAGGVVTAVAAGECTVRVTAPGAKNRMCRTVRVTVQPAACQTPEDTEDPEAGDAQLTGTGGGTAQTLQPQGSTGGSGGAGTTGSGGAGGSQNGGGQPSGGAQRPSGLSASEAAAAAFTVGGFASTSTTGSYDIYYAGWAVGQFSSQAEANQVAIAQAQTFASMPYSQYGCLHAWTEDDWFFVGLSGAQKPPLNAQEAVNAALATPGFTQYSTAPNLTGNYAGGSTSLFETQAELNAWLVGYAQYYASLGGAAEHGVLHAWAEGDAVYIALGFPGDDRAETAW